MWIVDVGHVLLIVIARATQCLPRQTAIQVLETTLLPRSEYGNRLTLGRQAQNLDEGAFVKGNDPLLALTYGEFPLESVDELLDRSLELRRSATSYSSHRLGVADVGSGIGRIGVYLALSRTGWDISGIEISELLHQQAVDAVAKACQLGYLADVDDSSSPSSNDQATTLSFWHGPAQDYGHILKQQDLVFCYSTTWHTVGFSSVSNTLLLSNAWNTLFTTHCRTGTIVVTTDRSLNPAFGWQVLDAMEVKNPEVGGSTAYIQQKL